MKTEPKEKKDLPEIIATAPTETLYVEGLNFKIDLKSTFLPVDKLILLAETLKKNIIDSGKENKSYVN